MLNLRPPFILKAYWHDLMEEKPKIHEPIYFFQGGITLRHYMIAAITAFLALYIGLECGYRIGHESALKSLARGSQTQRYGGLANGY